MPNAVQAASTALVPTVLPHPEQQPLLTAREVARILGLSVSTVYELAGRGELPVIRLSPRRYAFSTAEMRRRLGLDQ